MKKISVVPFVVLIVMFAIGMMYPFTAEAGDPKVEIYGGGSYVVAVDEGKAAGGSLYLTPRVIFGRKDVNFGIEGSLVGCDGKSGTEYEHTCLRPSVGPAVEFNPSLGLRIIFSSQIGAQFDSGSREKATGTYEAEQTTPIILATISVDRSTEAGKYWELWLGYVADLGGEKSSTWNGEEISSSDDPVGEKSRLDATARMYVLRGLPGNINLGLSGRVVYAWESDAFKKGGGPYISLGSHDSLKIGAEILNVSGSKSPEDNGYQAGLWVSASLHHLSW